MSGGKTRAHIERTKKKFSKHRRRGCHGCRLTTAKCPKTGELGALSKQAESGSKSSHAFGYDEKGGHSYGAYQIASRTGKMREFLEYSKAHAPDVYAALSRAGGEQGSLSGSKEFKAAWSTLATNGGDSFLDLQHEFIGRANYDPVVRDLRTRHGLDVTQRSAVLRDVVWSTAVQHGQASARPYKRNNKMTDGVIEAALRQKNASEMSDREIIEAIYDHRCKAWPAGCNARYKWERECALKALDEVSERSTPSMTSKQSPTSPAPSASGVVSPQEVSRSRQNLTPSSNTVETKASSNASAPGAQPPGANPATRTVSPSPRQTEKLTKEPSGSQWVSRYPTSRSLNDLVEPFQTNAQHFVDALHAAGATVGVSATYRPPERAYLMHYAWMIANEGMDPAAVPPFDGVEIDWAHRNSHGVADLASARRAATEMVAGYGIVHRPSLTSLHTTAQAIDMSIAWSGTLSIQDASGANVVIAGSPRNGSNTTLQAVGATYGVHKLATDPPHWSSTGH